MHAGHPGYDHTYYEGIQACKGFANKPQSQVMLRRGINGTLQPNTTQEKYIDSAFARASDAETSGCQACGVPAKMGFTAILLFNLLNVYMRF